MIRQTLNRLLTAIPTLGAVLIASFLLMRFAPGGPFDGERPLDDATRAALEASYGLDQPMWQQLITWLGRVLMGDFGPSLVYRDFTVTELVAQGLPTSMMLGGAAIILAFVIGLALGVRAALAPGGYLDKYLMLLATLLTALPVFVTGPLLVLLFAVTLRLLPLGGTGSIWHWVLPVIALSLPVAGAIAKLVRAALADLWQRDAIRTARARGLSRIAILYGHALRPALVPVVSYLGPAAAGMLTGAVVVETVFGLPGLGRYFVQGALNRDYPLIMAVVLIYALLIILFNLIADLLYAWLDPRVQR
ncbi:ABC transporter permease [Parasphingorhabdus sp. DH2-15]|uniref:ABC transporter permease n=1 Tax=Parasphingorhabdus sp. DH2-15 TaxID=3444112 RepID=UPI003F68591E